MAIFRLISVVFALFWASLPLFAQDLTALARVDTDQSTIKNRIFGGVLVDLALNQPVPFILNAADDPLRIFVDFEGLSWSSKDATSIEEADEVTNVAFGLIRPGWTRLVLELSAPLVVTDAEMSVDQADGSGRLRLWMKGADLEQFREEIRPTTLATSKPALPKERGDRRLRVVLDPGHGGVDPGAVVAKNFEKRLMLQFARELQEHLNKSALYDVYLTREVDEFVSLSGRIARAREVKGDLMISLHADALAEGVATGITVYTLSGRASDSAAEQLAREMDRTDILLGHDLSAQDDQITAILYDLAQRDTQLRSEALAEQMIESIGESLLQSRMRPRLSAAFTVLKAPDIPSILIELGFITNPRDLANLKNKAWRERVIIGIEAALQAWEIEDAARAKLLRK